MGSVFRLLVCGGLFIAGYYLGRQSHRLESGEDTVDSPEPPGVVAGRDDAAHTQNDAG